MHPIFKDVSDIQMHPIKIIQMHPILKDASNI
jgi:hypothetical protein